MNFYLKLGEWKQSTLILIEAPAVLCLYGGYQKWIFRVFLPELDEILKQQNIINKIYKQKKNSFFYTLFTNCQSKSEFVRSVYLKLGEKIQQH